MSRQVAVRTQRMVRCMVLALGGLQAFAEVPMSILTIGLAEHGAVGSNSVLCRQTIKDEAYRAGAAETGRTI